MIGLFDDNGDWQSTDSGLEDVVVDYFSSLFTAADLDITHMHSVVSLIQPSVTASINQ